MLSAVALTPTVARYTTRQNAIDGVGTLRRCRMTGLVRSERKESERKGDPPRACGIATCRSYKLTCGFSVGLADHEVEDIKANGITLLDIDLVSRRIGAAVRAGLLSSDHGDRLARTNQAAERYRAGMLWFCFFRPAIAGDGGIGDLLRFWGGEPIYNSHDRDPEIGPIIAAIGKPAIVVAEIPIAWCGGDRGLRLAMNIGQRLVVAQGTPSRNSSNVEENIKQHLPGAFIRQVHVHPSPEFMRLAGCADWYRPL